MAHNGSVRVQISRELEASLAYYLHKVSEMAAQPTPSYDSVPSVLIIDDRPENPELVLQALTQAGLTALKAATPKDGLDMFCKLRPQVVVTALAMQGMGGLDVLDRIMEIDASTDVVIMGAEDSADFALEAIKRGASDFIATPVSLDDLHQRIAKLVDRVDDTGGVFQLDSEWQWHTNAQFPEMVGRSPQMCRLFSRIRQVAPHYRIALVVGETGTGKELVARALHRLSPVSSGRFVALNCSAVVETLFESELFGHVRGSFTGAICDKPGLFEHAHGGTLFLDEIGDMPLAMQGKLLRVLQNQEVRRVGGLNTRAPDVHVVAASNCDLRAAVVAKRFREDLYYRLSMVEIEVPRLACRLGDLALLERHLIARFAAEFRKPIRGMTHRARKLLSQHAWPGNIRELENVLGYACMVTTNGLVDIHDLPPYLHSRMDPSKRVEGPSHDTFGSGTLTEQDGARNNGDNALLTSNVHREHCSLAAQERSVILQALKFSGGNQTRAAELLQISRDTLRYRLKKHNLAGMRSNSPVPVGDGD